MKILSWNVSRKSNFSPLVADLKAGKYDVICLQEVNTSFLLELKKFLFEYDIHTANEILVTRKKTHNLSLVTLINNKYIAVKNSSHKTYQSTLYKFMKKKIHIEYSYMDFYADENLYRIFNCHLQCVAPPSIRLLQINEVLKSFGSKHNNIICGDLNAFSRPYLFMIGPFLNYRLHDYFIDEKKEFNNLENLQNPLFNKNTSIYQTGQLDYILVPQHMIVNNFEVLTNKRDTSDHYPVYIETQLSTNNP